MTDRIATALVAPATVVARGLAAARERARSLLDLDAPTTGGPADADADDAVEFVDPDPTPCVEAAPRRDDEPVFTARDADATGFR